MLNLSDLLTIIKMNLGIYAIALPFEDTDAVFKQVLELNTLPTFSQFSPDIQTLNIHEGHIRRERNDFGEDILTIQFEHYVGDREVLYIYDVVQANPYIGYGGGMYMGGLAVTPCTYEDLMMAQVSADLASTLYPSMTSTFQPPNKLILHNCQLYNSGIVLKVALEHTKNLATIPNTSRESFLKLAMLDVKIFLFNTLKAYNEISTAYATINLKIDEWSNAESDRRELINRWEEIHHLDAVRSVFFF